MFHMGSKDEHRDDRTATLIVGYTEGIRERGISHVTREQGV